jgi:hypothetical protein
LERGLLGRVFFVRPLREMMEFAQPDNLDLARLVSGTGPLPGSNVQPKEADELKWRNGPGPGYSQLRATEYLTNRYRRTRQGLRITLPQIMRDERCRNLLLKLRKDGVLDWQIINALLTIVSQWQVETRNGRPLSSRKDAKQLQDRSFHTEQPEDPKFDLNVLTEDRLLEQLNFSLIAVLKTWELTCHRQTPDFVAVKRLLDERYRHSVDDIPHDDPFSI